MGLPIALQLYTVRDAMAKDFEGTLAKVAAIGFKHIEFAGLYERDPKAVRTLIDKLGLKAVSGHVGIDGTEANIEREAALAKILGYDLIVSSPPDGWKWAEKGTVAAYTGAVRTFEKASAFAKKHGLTYCYHNHSFEFDKLEDGRRGIDILFNDAKPPLASELDVYWVKHGHDDPVTWIKKLAGRVPLLHIKDMEKGEKRGFTEVGTGTVDMKAVVAAAPAAGVRYLIIEQDSNWKNNDGIESAKISFENFRKIAG